MRGCCWGRLCKWSSSNMSAWIIKLSLMPAFCAEYLFMIAMIILWEQTLIYLCTSCILLTQRDNGMYTECLLMCGLHYIHTVHNRSLAHTQVRNCSLHFRGQSWENRQTERVATWLHSMCCNLFFSLERIFSGSSSIRRFLHFLGTSGHRGM